MREAKTRNLIDNKKCRLTYPAFDQTVFAVD